MDHTSPSASVSRWTIRFVLLGGAVAWLLHLVLAYVIAEFGTLSGLIESRWLGLDLVVWLLLVLSVGALALAAAAVEKSLSIRNRLPPPRADEVESDRTLRFCARFGVITNLTFLVFIAVQTIPIFYFLRP